MKKHRLLRLLLVICIGSFIASPVQARQIVRPVTNQEAAGFSLTWSVSLPGSEIETVSVETLSISQAHSGFQKSMGNFSTLAKRPDNFIPFRGRGYFPGRPGRCKTYLSHNYPSHNFW